MKNKIILTALAITSAGAIALGTNSVSAQTAATESYPPIVQKLAQRFGLQENEVQAVFDEERTEHHQLMQQSLEDRLNQAVSDGTLTPEQMEAIKLKHQEMQEKRTAYMEDRVFQTPGERQEMMQSHREEFREWSEANGITFEQLFLGRQKMRMRN